MPKRDYQYFESEAHKILSSQNLPQAKSTFPESPYYAPHHYFDNQFGSLIDSSHKVLELGAGIGDFTGALLKRSDKVTVVDISPKSLEVLAQRYPTVTDRVVADMEDLPFTDSSFDFVVVIASLSYGNPEKVDSEILRVLKSGGHIVIIDSLRGNLLFTLNRFRYAISNSRSWHSVFKMPNIHRIRKWQGIYDTVSLKYFGSLVLLYLPIRTLFGERFASHFVSKFDVGANSRFAHKFFYLGKKVQALKSDALLIYKYKQSAVPSETNLQDFDLKTYRLLLTPSNIIKLHFSWRHVLHLFCRINSTDAYYLIVRQGSELVFRTLVHRCLLRCNSPAIREVSFSDVYTYPEFRRRGIAEYFLSREMNSTLLGENVLWVCRQENLASRLLCLKLGFTPFGTLLPYGKFGIFRYHYIRNLNF